MTTTTTDASARQVSRRAPSAVRLSLILSLLTGVAAAPSGGQSAEGQGRAVFHGGVEHVSLDVIVTDDHGNSVPDLTVADFMITEHGRRQDIVDFEHIAIPVVHRTVDSSAEELPPSDVATNVNPGSASRAFVFVVDDGTVRAEGIVVLKRVMLELLATMSPADRVAIAFVRRSDLAVDFTSDLARLLRGVDNVGKAFASKAADARATRLTLVNAVNGLATAPETRRALIYLGGGFQIVPAGSLDAQGPSTAFTMAGVLDLCERARRADVPIYAVDPHGLLAPDVGLESAAPKHYVDRQRQQMQDFMRTLPYNTQGLAVVNTNELKEGADAIIADNSDYYVLGYNPSPYVADQEFHDVEVAVTRPGLHVRARRGYFARTATNATDVSAQLAAALSEAQTHSALSLRVFLAPVAPKAPDVASIVTLDVSYPRVNDSQVRPDDDLDVAFIAADPDGKVLRSEPRFFHMVLSGTSREAVTVSLDDVLDLPPGKWMLRVAVASRALGTLGTAYLPVDIRDFVGQPLETSPLVLGLLGTTVLVGRPESIAAVVPLQPTTVRTFVSGARLRVFTRAFVSKATDVSAGLQLRTRAQVLRTVPVHVTHSPGLPNGFDCQAELPLTDLAPGTYVIQMTLRTSGNQSKTEALTIEVR